VDEIKISFIKNLIADKLPGEENHLTENITETACTQKGRRFYFRVKQVPTVFENGHHGLTFIIEDVTSRKESEEALKISEARYRGIVEDQTEFITRFRSDGALIYANDSYARYLGKKAADIPGEYHIPGIYDEDRAFLDRSLPSLDKENPVTTIECRIANPSGKTGWNLWTIRALYDNEGNLHEYQGVGRDITEKCESAAKINNYIKMMEFLSKTGRDFMDFGDNDDIYEYVARHVQTLSQGLLAWVGLYRKPDRTLILQSLAGSPEAIGYVQNISGMKDTDIIVTVGNDDPGELIRNRRLVKIPTFFQSSHMQNPEEICSRISDTAGECESYIMELVSKGRIIGYIGMCTQCRPGLKNRDYIEAFIQQAAIAIDRKIAEDALKSSEQLYRSVIENIEDVYYRADEDGILIMASPSWAKILGYNSLDDCIGKNIANTFYMDPEKRKEFVEKFDRVETVTDYEVVLKQKDGSPLHVAVSSHRFYDENGNVRGIEGIFRDMTQRHAATEEIKNHIARMEFFSRKIQDFIELQSESDIYAKIAADLKTMAPDAMILLNSYDNTTGMVTLRCLLDETDHAKCTDCLGFDPVGIELKMDSTAHTGLKTGILHKVSFSLYDLTFRGIPEDICNCITDAVNIGDIYAIGFARGGVIYGNAAILLHKGATVPDMSLIDTYAHAASIALQRDIAEKALKENERKQAEEALKNSENYLLTIFNSTQSGLMVIDPQTSAIFDVNSTAAELIGAKKNEITGKSCKKFLCHAEDAPCPFTELGEDVIRREGVLTTTGGEKKPIIKTVVPVSVGNRAYLLESFIDMSGRKEAEAALHDSEKWFRCIIEMIPQSVWECDIEGNLTYANSRCYEMFRYTPEDMKKGLNLWQMIHPDDREWILNEFKDAILHKPSEFPRHHELQGLRKDGTTFPMMVYHIPIVCKNENCGMRGISIDITDHKRIYNAIKDY
jgi:PAS domain S-box